MEILLERLLFLRCQTDDGVTARKNEQAVDVSHVLDDLVEEVDTQNHTQSLHVGRRLVFVYNVFFADDEHIPRVDIYFLGVESILNLPFHTESDEDKVHLTRLCRHGRLVDVFCQ